MRFEIPEEVYQIYYLYKETRDQIRLTEIGKTDTFKGGFSTISNSITAEVLPEFVYSGLCKRAFDEG